MYLSPEWVVAHVLAPDCPAAGASLLCLPVELDLPGFLLPGRGGRDSSGHVRDASGPRCPAARPLRAKAAGFSPLSPQWGERQAPEGGTQCCPHAILLGVMMSPQRSECSVH